MLSVKTGNGVNLQMNPHEQPIFVLASHRSSGTLIQRVLNCHPDLVIWGEQGGVLNKFAELDAVARNHEHLRSSPEKLAKYVTKDQNISLEFDAWVNPFNVEEFRNWCRSFLISIHSGSLDPKQRWGIKEIRYVNPRTCQFLGELFPAAQFVLLRRNPVELCISNILVPWSLDALRCMGAGFDSKSANEVLADCAYAISAIEWQFQEVADLLEGRCLTVWHRQMPAAVDVLFNFLDLPLNEKIRERIELALMTQVGTTDLDGKLGLLDKNYIQENAPALLEQARQSISMHGFDWGRLRRLGRTGRYTFLVGDHHVLSTDLSSVF